MISNSTSDGSNASPIWSDFFLRHWSFIVLALILVFAAGIRLHLLEMPLERDEGEYAYMGQLLLQGIPPYKAAYNMKWPGTYVAYAAIMAIFDVIRPGFGQTIAAIHLGLILVNAASIVLIFLIARRIWDEPAGLMAAATFALLTMGRGSLGLAGHATHFVVLPMLAALLLLVKNRTNQRLWPHFVIGVLLGIAALMKQPGALYAPFFAIFPLWDELRRRPIPWLSIITRLLLLGLGFALMLLTAAAILWVAGVFDKFWFWTISYAAEYGSQIPPDYRLQMFWLSFRGIIDRTILLWILAGIGLVLVFFRRDDRRQFFFITTFAFFSFLTVCPGYLFRQHYYILMMPAVGMLIGAGLSSVTHWLKPRLGIVVPVAVTAVFMVSWLLSFYWEREVFLARDPVQACRNLYGINPFPESVVIAEYIRNRTQPGDTIAVIGSEPQICFYAQRRSATGYIYMYPLMETHPYALKMQQEMAAEIEAANPKYLVLVNIYQSWLVRPNSSNYIYGWYTGYVGSRSPEVVVDVFEDHVEYRWNRDAAGSPRTKMFIAVFRLN